MGFWDLLKRPISPTVFEPNVTHFGTLPDALRYAVTLGPDGVRNLTPAQMFFCQPHLRTVVTFLARNIAQLGVHVFARDGEDRVRDRTSPLALLLRQPNPDQTAYELIFATVGDRALYDRAYWLVVPAADAPSGWVIRRLPPNWVSPVSADAFSVTSYLVRNGVGDVVEVPADTVLAFTGYHPESPRKGSPTVEALKDTLNEQIEAARYRGQIWKRGGRVSAVLQRPAEAPEWSEAAREAFREDWYSKYTGRGSRAGGTPILEDGMTLERVDFNAQEQQFVEAAKLAFSTVASAFHVNPTMVGVLDNANYSNVREFRRMLYGDTLGPEIASIEDRINTFLLPMLGMDPGQYFAEFNIAEKLQGSFEEQSAALQTAIGRPWMTANEGRKIVNLPALGNEADRLVTPLNVLVGGQASPTDSGSQNVDGKSGAKVYHLEELPSFSQAQRPIKAITAPQRDKIAEVLAGFFERQGKAVLSRISTDADWWDVDRWDAELAEDMSKVMLAIGAILGKTQAERLGYPDDFNPDRTVNFLTTVATRYAGAINSTTKSQLDRALESDSKPADVFATARESRASGTAMQVGTFVAGFAATEAARQVGEAQGVSPMKTWETGPNPRPEHAALDGETVGIDDTFSNGGQWPGDDGECGCNCSISIDF